MTSVAAPPHVDLCLDTLMTRMDTGQVILVDTPPESLTNGDVSMLDITKIEGIPLDAPKDGAVYYDEKEDVYWIDVTMGMTSDDERFGFSVMGGYDEGFLPQIDEISIGSPADQAQLEVGDEIVEVNGQNLEDYSHAEVIDLIHESIASRSIRLQVRRRPLTEEDAENRVSSDGDIQDAFVVATDPETHSNLQQLAALYKVSPVNIADGYDYSNTTNTDHACNDAETDHKLSTCSDPITNSPPAVRVCRTESPTRDAASPVLEHNFDSSSRDANSETMETSVVNGFGPVPGHVTGLPALPGENMYVAENGPHREMAIDCPVGFVSARKEPPRFPPPQSINSSQSSLRSQHSTPSRGSEAKRHAVDQPAAAASVQKPPKMTKEEHLEHLERIQIYQEDLRKRHEKEQQVADEEAFLRASLRGSKKMQALQESPLANEPAFLPSGIVNPNYVEEDDASSVGVSASKSSTLPLREKDRVVLEDLSTEDLLASLQHIQSRLTSIDDQKQIAQLTPLFHNRAFRHALQAHNKIVAFSLRSPRPTAAGDATSLNEQVVARTTTSDSPLARELTQLLQSPHLKSLLTTHDKIAHQKSVPPKTTTAEDETEYILERASQYGEDSIKIVRLQKTADPLGATVRNEGDSVIVGRIVKGGMAEKSGLLHEGDEIIEINGIDIRGKSVNDVCDLMASLTGTLTFLVVPCNEFPVAENEVDDSSVMHVKAHFDYDPEDDLYIPCRELGISFQKGDILHVINQDDPNWWQAYREGEDDQTLAGLIPSRVFQEQREATKQTIVEKKDKKKRHRCKCGVRRGHRNKKKKQLYSADGEGDSDEILAYEEVALYYPQPNRKRPIVLIGPPNVGRQELRQRLMESDPERFAPALPHTSRAPKDGEIDGKDYHFVPRAVFEADITSHKFVEFGEFEKSLYGTSLEAIRQVINIGKICVLNFYPQSLTILKTSDLKPYVAFIAPPQLQKLKQLRQHQGVKVTDDELKDIIEKSREMEENYIQYFDMIVCNYDLDRAYDELLEGINQLDVNPQWVPSTWVT